MSTHRHPRGTAVALAACLALGAGTAHAQPQLPSALPSPRLLLVTPPGARAGTSVEVTLTGTDLESPDRLVFSHPDIKAEPVAAPEPPKPAPGKAPPPRPRRGMTGTPTVTKFKVTVPAGVPLGMHDVRLVNKWGVSNPRAFVVGDLAEVAEKEPNNDQPEAQRVEINSTVNGAMASPVDVDYFVFAGKKGQRVVLSCLASSIDSRFEPSLELYDGKNNLLTSNHAYRGNDALTDCTLPADGDYYVRLAEFTYTRGNAEHFYRLSITTAPWIAAVHPCVLEPGKATQVTVYGRNLPGGKLDPAATEGGVALEKMDLTVTAPSDPAALNRLAFSGHVPPGSAGLSGFEVRVRNAAGASNPFLLTLARAPVVRDNEANDTPATAQELTPPCEVAGRVEKRGDRDWYTFAAKKGDVYVIDVQSERLGAPTFMYFMLRNEKGQELFESQDVDMNALSRKFWSRSDDPAPYRFVAPADGKYQLLVGSRTADTLAGPRHYYRLRIAPERPDFELVAMAGDSTRPSGAGIPAGGNGSLTVVALREDGFAGDIALNVEGLPPGITCPPQALGPGQREGRIALHADAAAKPWVGEIKVKGTATVRGQKVVREARPAGIVWPVQPQQNTPTISRLDRSLMLAVGGPAPWDLGLALDKPALTHNERGSIKLNLKRLWPDFKGPLAVQAQQGELPRGLNVNNNQPVTVAAGKNDGTLTVVANNQVPPGVYTVVLRSQAQVPYNRDPAAKQKPNVNVIQYSAPLTLTVLPKELARLSLSNLPAVKIGAQAELVVKVNRLYNFDGEFKVEVVLPPKTEGVEVAGAVIPAGKDEAKLVVKVPAGAAPGGRNNLVVRATAVTHGHPIKHEVKFNVNVVK